ncbi:MAG: hypothetical protein LIO93_07010 [Bacteroidales bacterium]|nr:hypothetical protein [Bacteroidales bacterium]
MKTIQLLFIVLLLFPIRLSSQELVVDETFGEKGTVSIPGIDWVLSTAVDSKGNILMTAYPEYGKNTMAVIKVDSNGVLDEDFGAGGIFTIPIDTLRIPARKHNIGLDLRIDLNDNIVVTGFDQDENLVLVRITKNGILDEKFGENGIMTIDKIGGLVWLNSVVIQSDNRILIGGWYHYSTPESSAEDIFLIRLTSEGKLDETFGEKGKVLSLLGLTDYSSVTVLEDYSLLLVVPSNILVKLKNDGSLDESFNGNGMLTLTYKDLRFTIEQLSLLSDQSFLVAGKVYFSVDPSGYCFKMDLQGNFVTDFGEDGVLAEDGILHSPDIIEQPDGKVLFLGTDLVRITSDGKLDTGFADNGVFSHTKDHLSYSLFGFTLQEDGKIMLSKFRYATQNYYITCLDNNGEVLFDNIFYQLDRDYTSNVLVYNDTQWMVVSQEMNLPLHLTRIKLKMKDDTSLSRIESVVSVYPSGTPGSLKIESKTDPVRSVTITGIDGRLLFSKNYGSQHSVQVDNLPVNTVVILRITLEAGEVISGKSVL